MNQTNSRYQTNQTTLDSITDTLAEQLFNMYSGEDYLDNTEATFKARFNLHCYGPLANLVHKLNMWINYGDTKDAKYQNSRHTTQKQTEADNLGDNVTSDSQFVIGQANTNFANNELTTQSERTLFSGYNFKDLIDTPMIKKEWQEFTTAYATHMLLPLF